MENACGYTRVSTPQQALKPKTSLDEQKAAIQKYAKAMEWKLGEIYEDVQSGGAKEAPAWIKNDGGR